jgi:hypothetical protein
VKKPINKVAVAIWVIAALMLASAVISVVQMQSALIQGAKLAGNEETFLVVNSSLTMMERGIASIIMLAAFGYLIELVDQIRWNALNHSK